MQSRGILITDLGDESDSEKEMDLLARCHDIHLNYFRKLGNFMNLSTKKLFRKCISVPRFVRSQLIPIFKEGEGVHTSHLCW